jgi:hypothetical protein
MYDMENSLAFGYDGTTEIGVDAVIRSDGCMGE